MLENISQELNENYENSFCLFYKLLRIYMNSCIILTKYKSTPI